MLRIGAQRIHVPSLAFCVYRVECKRRLAAAAESGDDDKFVARDAQARSFEVVGLRSSYFDIFFTHY